MSIRDAAALLSSIGKVADVLQTLGNNYIQASAASKRFPSQVCILKAKLEHLKVLLNRNQQLRLDSDFEALEEVEKLVTDQVNILKQNREDNHGKNCGIKPCCSRFGEMVFPKQIGLAVEDATELLSVIISHFETIRLDKGAAVTRCHSLSSANFNTDSYVRLERTESEIYSALDKSDAPSPTVVLIYGAPGRGKSTVARQVGLSLGKSKERFAHALFLECDRQKEVGAAETGLLQMLRGEDSSQNVRLLERVSQTDVAGRQTLSIVVQTSEGDELSEKVGVRGKLLKSFLRKEKLLIILDDVLDGDFVKHFLDLSGEEVKFIITARHDICEGLSYKYTPIQIEELRGQDDETSKKILAVHAGLSDQIIPDDCKGVAAEILSKADGLPLVIAQIGARLGPANRDLKVWRSVADNFLVCLEEKPSRHVLNAGYNQTIWAALKQAYRACSEKAQKLLLLLGMCDGSSVSEVVLHFLYDVAFSRGERFQEYLFQKTKSELKGSQLVSENQKSYLSLHSSTKDFILEKMKKEVNEIAGNFLHQQPTKRSFFGKKMSHTRKSLVGSFRWQDSHIKRQDSQSKFIIFLSCLYLDTRLEFHEQIVLQTCLSFDTFSPLKRSVVEPLIHLLASQWTCCSDRTPTEPSTSAMQIFLQFIGSDELDYNHLLQLLNGSLAVMETLQFLQNVPSLKGPFWEKNSISGLASSIINIFKDLTHQDVNIQARKTLLALCQGNEKANTDIVDTPNLLDYLVQSISQFENRDLSVKAACLLVGIAFGADATIRKRIADCPKLLESLAASLPKATNPELQRTAASALANLASGPDTIREKIFSLYGLPDKLVQSVAQDQNFKLAAEAAGVIQNLTSTENLTLSDQIARIPNLLESLAASLPKATNPKLQTRAAAALVNLTNGPEPNREKVFSLYGLPDKLVQSLAQDRDSGLAAEAAGVIQNLAATKNSNLKDQIACVPKLLQSLATSLPKATNPKLQTRAAIALANLAIDTESNRERIFSLCGLLDELVRLVAQDQNFDLAANAALVIQNVAATKNLSLNNQIACVPRLLQSLAASLPKATNPELQTRAAGALARLAFGLEPIRERIFSLWGLPDELVRLVAQDHNSDLAANAVFVIQNLAATANLSLNNQIACVPRLLSSLAASLPKATNPNLQTTAATALALLAFDLEQNREKIFNLCGLPDELVRLVVQDQNFDLAANAALVIQALARTENLSLKDQIACIPNLLDSLAASLPKATNPKLQTRAATALALLAVGPDPNQERIFSLCGLQDELVRLVAQDLNFDLAANAAAVIQNLAGTENLSLKDQITSIPNLLDSLAASLPKTTNPKLQTRAATALANLAIGTEPNRERIFSLCGLPDELVRLVAQDQNFDLAAKATLVIQALAGTENLSLKDQIACVPNLLDSLAASLCKAMNPKPQTSAAGALANLAVGHEPNQERIFSMCGLPDELVRLVAQDQNLDLVASATAVIQALAGTKNLSLKDQIACVPNLLDSLAASLRKAMNPKLQTSAAGALANLAAGHEPNRERIISLCGLPDELVQLVAQDQNFDLAANAAAVIQNLTGTENLSLKDQITCIPNLLDSLAAALPKATNPKLQTRAATALANLANGPEPNREKIFSICGLPDELVRLVAQDQNLDLVANATAVIQALTGTKNLSLKDRIACVPNLLDSLAASLPKATNPELQTSAAAALANLAIGPEPNRGRIFNLCGLPDELVRLVAQDQNFDLAANAAAVILNLAGTENLSLKDQIACIPNLLDSLAASLPKANPKLQTRAATALALLAIGPDPNQERIFSLCGLPDKLVQSLAQDRDSGLAAEAAGVIQNLAATKKWNLKNQIACYPKLLDSLAASLPKATNPKLQTRAAIALALLAIGPDPNQERIFSLCGLPDKLVQSLAQDRDSGLAAEAAGVIQNLAATKKWNLKNQIASIPKLLQSLAASLPKATNPKLQTRAATALANLAFGPEPNRERIFSLCGIPDELVRLVAQDQNFDLAAKAALVIQNLAGTETLSLKDRIACIPNLLECLRASLPKATNPELQTRAVAALANLTCGPEPTRERIFNLCGLSDELVRLVAQDQNFDLAAMAVGVIGNLAETENLSLKDRIACIPNLLESLRSASAHEERRDLHRWSVEALAKLGYG